MVQFHPSHWRQGLLLLSLFYHQNHELRLLYQAPPGLLAFLLNPLDPEFQQSGVHWSWGNRQSPGAEPFAQALSAKANDSPRAARLWDLSAAMVGIGETA